MSTSTEQIRKSQVLAMIEGGNAYPFSPLSVTMYSGGKDFKIPELLGNQEQIETRKLVARQVVEDNFSEMIEGFSNERTSWRDGCKFANPLFTRKLQAEINFSSPDRGNHITVAARIFPVMFEGSNTKTYRCTPVNPFARFGQYEFLMLIAKIFEGEKILQSLYNEVLGQVAIAYEDENQSVSLDLFRSNKWFFMALEQAGSSDSLIPTVRVYDPTPKKMDEAARLFSELWAFFRRNKSRISKVTSIIDQANRLTSTLRGVDEKYAKKIRETVTEMYEEADEKMDIILKVDVVLKNLLPEILTLRDIASN